MGRAIMKEQGVDIDEKSVAEFAKTLRPERMSAGVRIVKSPADRKQEARRKLRCKMARERAPKYSLYVLRHSWATHALEKGLDALTVAVLMGHRDPSTLAKVYQHLAHNPSFLLEQARKAAG